VAEETRWAKPSGGGGKGMLAWVVILGLAGLVGWLFSERNAGSWHLVPDEGRLVVMRGVFFPVGRQAFETSDPALAQAYGPLVAPPGTPLPAERRFGERADLDQALFDLLAGWAREEIASRDPARLERGLGYLVRADRLAGISGAQRETLAGLRAESGYFEARRLLERATDDLRQAAEKLRLAASLQSAHGADAQWLLRQVEPLVDGAIAASRAASPRPAESGSAPAAAGAAPPAQGAVETPPRGEALEKPAGPTGR
jgi:hypothetical protein